MLMKQLIKINLKFMEESDRNNKLIAMELIATEPMEGPLNFTRFLDYIYDSNSLKNKMQFISDVPQFPEELINKNDIVKDIKGKIRIVSEKYLDEEQNFFGNNDIEIGDSIYYWDSGGWMTLSGRAGEIVIRNDKEIISIKLLRMS